MMNSIPRALFVSVYDRNGRIERSSVGFPDSKSRIPRMEVTAKAEGDVIEQLRQMAQSWGASFKMTEGTNYSVEIAADSNTYSDVRSKVSAIVFAKA